MNKMNDIEVIINNKRLTLCGYESEEYLQKVASYINNKYHEFKTKDCFGKLDTELRNVLLEINIADDYFKVMKQIKEMEEESEVKSNDLFHMKHEVIAAETELAVLQKELEEVKKELNESQKKIVRLETELEDCKKQQKG